MRPKIIEENVDNFNAVAKDTVARFVNWTKIVDQNDHIPDLEGELSKWSTESKLHQYHMDESASSVYLYTDMPSHISLVLLPLLNALVA